MFKRTKSAAKKKQYLLYSEFTLLIPKMSTCSFHCNFLHSTLHTLHHFRMSEFPSPSVLLSDVIFRNKTKILLYPVLCSEGAIVTVQLNNSGAALCWQWGSPTHRTQQMTTWPQSRSSSTYIHRTISQLCCTLIHWHTLTQIVLSTVEK